MPGLDATLPLMLLQSLMFLQVAVGIGFLILIHELGHFLAARRAGVRVEVFSIGFGPRLLGWRRGDTDYRLSLVPLGGYVKVAGESRDSSTGRSDDLASRTAGQKALFFSGGVIMNLLFALIVFPIVFWTGVPFTAPEVGMVERGSPAWEAGLQHGDRVLEVEGKAMYSFDNLMVELALADPAGAKLLVRPAESEDARAVVVRPEYLPAFGFRAIGIHQPIEPRLRIEVPDPDGPAGRAGLRSGDVLVALDGQPIEGPAGLETMRELMAQRRTGPVEVTVEREGQRPTFSVAPAMVDGPWILGVRPPQRRVRGLRSQVPVVARSGLERGDEILSAQGSPVFLLEDLERALPPSGDVVLEVAREGRTAPLRLSFPVEDRGERDAFLENVVLGPNPAPDTTVVPVPGSAAERAGIQPGDRLVTLEGRPVRRWEDIRTRIQALGGTGDGEASEVLVGVERPGDPPRTVEATVVPRRDPVEEYGFRLVSAPLMEIYRVPGVWGATKAGLVSSVDLIKQLAVTLKRITSGDVSPTNLGGIITITRATYHFAREGWARFLFFLGLLSINLAFINVLPIPILDGGHLLFLLIETIKGSPVSERVLTYAQILGMVFIVGLLVFVTFNDIQRLLRG